MFNELRIKEPTRPASKGPASRGPASRVIIALGIFFAFSGCSETTTSAAASSNVNTSAAPLLEVSHAKVRGLLPGRNMTAAYFTVKNNRSTAVTLSGAKSISAGAVEMHTVETVAEQMRMRPLLEVSIEPGQSATFVSGSHHLMLFDVAEIGKAMTITLQFTDGTELPIEFSKVDIAGGGH